MNEPYLDLIVTFFWMTPIMTFVTFYEYTI